MIPWQGHLRQLQAFSANTSPILEVHNFSVHRSGFAIPDDISWQVREGENRVILGANGSAPPPEDLGAARHKPRAACCGEHGSRNR